MTSTTAEYSHLSPKAQEQLTLPDKDRIRLIQAGTWLPLDHAKTTLQKLEDLLDYPKVTRMPSYLIVGPSYSGKTSILERFRDQHLPDLDPEQEVTRCPVVMVDAPPKPDLSDFYSRIMDSLMAPYKPTAPVYEKYSQVKRLFGEMDARTDRMGRLVTLNVCGSHGDLGGVMGSYCYVVRPYNTGSVRAIR